MKISRLRFLVLSAFAALASVIGLRFNSEERARKWLLKNGFFIQEHFVNGWHVAFIALEGASITCARRWCGKEPNPKLAIEYVDWLREHDFTIIDKNWWEVETVVKTVDSYQEFGEIDLRQTGFKHFEKTHRFTPPWFI